MVSVYGSGQSVPTVKLSLCREQYNDISSLSFQLNSLGLDHAIYDNNLGRRHGPAQSGERTSV